MALNLFPLAVTAGLAYFLAKGTGQGSQDEDLDEDLDFANVENWDLDNLTEGQAKVFADEMGITVNEYLNMIRSGQHSYTTTYDYLTPATINPELTNLPNEEI